MKTGRMMTAAALMAAMATADTKATIQRFAMMLQAGTFRSRGKGRGSISPRFGKPGGNLKDSGFNGAAATRRRAQMRKGTLRMANGATVETLL